MPLLSRLEVGGGSGRAAFTSVNQNTTNKPGRINPNSGSIAVYLDDSALRLRGASRRDYNHTASSVLSATFQETMTTDLLFENSDARLVELRCRENLMLEQYDWIQCLRREVAARASQVQSRHLATPWSTPFRNRRELQPQKHAKDPQEEPAFRSEFVQDITLAPQKDKIKMMDAQFTTQLTESSSPDERQSAKKVQETSATEGVVSDLTEPGSHTRTTATNFKFRLLPGQGLPMIIPTDRSLLSDFQILIRESLEFFEVQPSDLWNRIPGRKKVLRVGQVGIRCRHCAHLPSHRRGRGAVYYPRCVESIYQAAQNVAANHFLISCTDMPTSMRKKFHAAREKQCKTIRRSGGKSYWTETSRYIGLEERQGYPGLWFAEEGKAEKLSFHSIN